MKKLLFFIVISLLFDNSFGQPLSGVKTINRTGGDYSSFSSAINALNTYGVIFDVDSGFIDKTTNLEINTKCN